MTRNPREQSRADTSSTLENRDYMNFFKKKSPKEKLEARYKKLLEESYKLSHTDRKASDEKAAQADALLKEIEALG